jgi:hypothetical protein
VSGAGTSMAEGRAALAASRQRVLAAAIDAETILTQAAGARVVAAWTLFPRRGILFVISRWPTLEPGATWPGSPPTMPGARFPRS